MYLVIQKLKKMEAENDKNLKQAEAYKEAFTVANERIFFVRLRASSYVTRASRC